MFLNVLYTRQHIHSQSALHSSLHPSLAQIYGSNIFEVNFEYERSNRYCPCFEKDTDGKWTATNEFTALIRDNSNTNTTPIINYVVITFAKQIIPNFTSNDSQELLDNLNLSSPVKEVQRFQYKRSRSGIRCIYSASAEMIIF